MIGRHELEVLRAEREFYRRLVFAAKACAERWLFNSGPEQRFRISRRELQKQHAKEILEAIEARK